MPPIKVYCDENVNLAIVEGLKRAGIEVLATREAGNLGASDREQFEYANAIGACIFTHDDDFLKLADEWAREGRDHHGVIYISQEKARVGYCVRRIKAICARLSRKDMENHVEFL